MHLQVSAVEKNQGLEVMSEIGEADFERPVRKRRVSGPDSEGEKSLLENSPAWLTTPKARTPVFNSCLSFVDEVVATPGVNISVVGSACDSNFKFFDEINNSQYVACIDSLVGALGFFSISVGYYVNQYCKLREIERESNYFYFSRLSKAFNEEKIKNKIGEIKQDNVDIEARITFEHLLAAAYFYPPDISKIACWRRRLFASGKKREQLEHLNTFLNKNSKKEMLNKLYNRITESICQLLNSEANLPNFQTKKNNDSWTIVLSNNYEKKFFEHEEAPIKRNSKANKVNNDKTNRNFLSPILAALGKTSFIYWILVFILYFIPAAPVVTTAVISVVPLGIALFCALPCLLFFEIKSAHKAYNSKKNMTEEDIKKEYESILQKKLLKLNKQKIFFKLLSEKDSSVVELKISPLMNDLRGVIKNRRFSKCHAMFVGFLDGCFLPLFVGWLLLDATKVILTYVLCPPTMALTSFIPIGLVASGIIAGIVFLISVSYGIYSAYKANQIHEAKFKDLTAKVNVLNEDALEDKLLNKRISNKSLQGADRLLRRFNDEDPLWTNVKKVLNRFSVVIKRLGTGSLLFRLVMWGPISAIVAASTAIVPVFFSTILVVGAVIGALLVAFWFLYAYNFESKLGQAGRVVEYLVETEQLDCIDKDLQNTLSKDPLGVGKISSTTGLSEQLAEFPTIHTLTEVSARREDRQELFSVNQNPAASDQNTKDITNLVLITY